MPIMVKRFERIGNTTRKVCTEVTAPLELDLGRHIAVDPGMPMGSLPQHWYDLVAVICHRGGSLATGHYHSLVKDPTSGTWYDANDDSVTTLEPARVSFCNVDDTHLRYLAFTC